MMSTTHASLQVFLESLFQPGDGLIELRALPSKRRAFVTPGDIASVQKFIRQNEAENLYCAVAARIDSSSGRLENCSVVRAVFADVDFKVFASEAEAVQVLKRF